MNSSPRVVLPVPGPPVTTVMLPRGTPPIRMVSSPLIPVLANSRCIGDPHRPSVEDHTAYRWAEKQHSTPLYDTVQGMARWKGLRRLSRPPGARPRVEARIFHRLIECH